MWDEFGVGSSLPPEVLRFSPLLINQHFQLPIQPGMVDKEPLGGCARLIPIRYYFVSLVRWEERRLDDLSRVCKYSQEVARRE